MYHSCHATRQSYKELLRNLEGRFGEAELSETSRAQFQQAVQKQQEFLEEWANRVLTLATPSLKELPESYARQETITKFCQGCWDREAGKHACLEKPRSFKGALAMVKHFQYFSQAVDMKRCQGFSSTG